MTAPADDAALALSYHRRTEHHPQRFARSLGYLDWDTQPDPFRTWAGAPLTALPLAADGVATRYGELYVPGAVAPEPLEPRTVAAFLELALGLTAWKEFGDARWALRSDPSSGNLHPTEGYLVLPDVPGLAAGVHHYVSRDHALEQRCALEGEAADALARRLPSGGFLVGLTSIHWRESWKYGERAFRYCNHDLGHVIGTVRLAAAALGWRAWLADGFGDARVARLLGLDREQDLTSIERDEREHPGTLLVVAPGGDVEQVARLEEGADELCALVAGGAWAGTPNALSPSHVSWDIVDAVAAATAKPPSRTTFAASEPPGELPLGPGDAPAATIVRQRRSAVALDGETRIPRDAFYALLARLLPGRERPPFDALPWPPRVHLALFVHRVEGLTRGLYLLERHAGVHDTLVAQLGAEAKWTRPPGCPEGLRLFRIAGRDLRRAAEAVSCGQEIAADGAFSLGMLAEFRDVVERGAWEYRRLFWETGVIGQVLYLEAEALGVRGTGIGCFFDGLVHRLVGLEDDALQSLYHFTVGAPVEDRRLVTHPPYAHLARERRS